VAARALAVLAARPVDGEMLAEIGAGAQAGASVARDAALLSFASRHLDGGAPMRALLESLASSTRDRQLQSRARALLAQVNG
jgi:hypothetical protein